MFNIIKTNKSKNQIAVLNRKKHLERKLKRSEAFDIFLIFF